MVREYNNYYNCEDTATGFVNVQRTSSGFLAQLLMGIMIDIHWIQRGGNDFEENDTQNRRYSVSDYNFAFLLCTISVGLAIIMLFFLKETYGKNIIYDDYQRNTVTAHGPESDNDNGALCTKRET